MISKTLIIRGEGKEVQGGIYEQCRSSCIQCEKFRNRNFRDCPRNDYGGKKKQEIGAAPVIKETCYYCHLTLNYETRISSSP